MTRVSWIPLAALALAQAHAAPPAKPAAPAHAPLHIVVTDKGYDAPDRVPSGVRHIVFENHGKEIHEAMLVKLPKGMSAEQYATIADGGTLFPEGGVDYSGPGLLSPGERTEQWDRLDPGEYVIICWNHHASGKVRQLRVLDQRVDDATPREDTVLKLVDFRFEFSKPVKRGVQTIRVETPGPSMHEGDIWRLLPGKTRADVVAWRKAHGKGEPAAVALGGVLDSDDLGRVVWVRREFTPGRYLLQCEMPMDHAAQSGTGYATHTDAGMLLDFEVE